MNDPAHRLFRGFQPKAASRRTTALQQRMPRGEAVSECVFQLREKRVRVAGVSRTLRFDHPTDPLHGIDLRRVSTRVLAAAGCDESQQKKRQIERQMNKGNVEKTKFGADIFIRFRSEIFYSRKFNHDSAHIQ
jgi:hypothetical protein